MPVTVLAVTRSRWITSSALSSRSARGLSLMKMRPPLVPGVGPPGPTVELKYSTALSARMMSATLRCISDSAANDTSGRASVVAKMKPVSSLGKKPLGMTM